MSAEQVPLETPTLRSVLRGRRGGFLAALLLAEFAGAMQGIAYSTVLPVIAADLDGFALFGATLAAGSVAAVLMLSFAPGILRRVSPQRLLLSATVLYVVGALTAVFAPSMAWVLLGTVIRGTAAGLFGGFGMGAIGALFDERERPRVFGLFALIWLLPSVVGPPLNALIAESLGWRWAVGWPAVLVVVARLLMGLTISTVPWERGSGHRVAVGFGLAVAASLAVGAWGSTVAGVAGSIALVAGVVCGGAAIAGYLVRGLPAARGTVIAFALLCATYFGATELLALTIVQGLGSSVLVASVAVTGGLLAWSLAGLRPRPDTRPDPATVGPVLVLAGVGAVIGGLAVGSGLGIALVIVGAVLAGAGMGAAYPLLSSEPFTTGAPTSTVGSMIAFAETSATAWSALVAGGSYSALHGSGWRPVPALQIGYALLALLGIATVIVSARRRGTAFAASGS
ncbi:MAG: MFS transporter [Nakamurella sp.]